MIEANRWKLGLFIIIGVVLLLGGIIIFGISQFFVPTVNVMTIFDESVDGLSVGSPVKYNGVPMGAVTRIVIDHGGNISVYMKLYPDVIDMKSRTKVIRNLMDKDYIRNIVGNYVKKGFRCSLQLSGISGNKYVGIERYNIYEDSFKETNLKEVIGDNIYIPAVPTYISGVPDNVSILLNKISQINFDELGSSINGNLSSIHAMMVKINALLTTLNSQEFERILLQTTSKLDETLNAATELCNQISEQPNSVFRGNESSVIFPAK
jgi:phospholipid/cholesterol/gamma-HCH transport system substrate-binding protein